ncbi:sensor histidine kinase [Streptomyces sp. NPDC002574]|uniref:sensor histidine kinase n=1 Tax=Streptomyces sp. NPDC002574 TaxID=3364652 RepID=UPI00369B14AF
MTLLRTGTVGLRFTILYAAAFLASGTGLLALTFLLSGGRVTRAAPGNDPAAPDSLAVAQQHIRALQGQLAEGNAQHSRQLLVGSLLALVVMALVSLLIGRTLARRVLRPLRLITAATRRISADNLDRRLAVTGPADEVRDLAETIDDLLERLEASFAAQRRFVANASHELRTPLTTMRASLDVAVAKPEPAASTVALAGRLRGQLDRVDHLLDGFLVLARAQHGALAGGVAVELSGLVGQAVAERAAEAEAKRLRVTVEARPETWTRGNPAMLARLVGNVVDNAVVHNEDGGWIRVLVSGGEDEGGAVRFVVESGGPVLDQREVDRLDRPFERLGAERTGSSGLGLSIVAAVAEAHGGRLDLRARTEGGLRVAVALPGAGAEVRA